MAVVVKIPTQLRAVAGGDAEAQVEGSTVQEVLDALFLRYEELGARIAEEDGSLRRFVNVYLAGEDIRFLEGLETPVLPGSELTILPAVAGG
jgi:molybdopterin converting factor small subunit